ncbi:hypothetical protein ACJX0J_027468, partial [Zea mays]
PDSILVSLMDFLLITSKCCFPNFFGSMIIIVIKLDHKLLIMYHTINGQSSTEEAANIEKDAILDLIGIIKDENLGQLEKPDFITIIFYFMFS